MPKVHGQLHGSLHGWLHGCCCMAVRNMAGRFGLRSGCMAVSNICSDCMAGKEHGCGVAWLTGWVDPLRTSSRSAFFGDRRACVLAARTRIGQRTWGGVGVGRAESARETGGALWSPGTMSELGAPELHGGDGRIAYPILALYTPSACVTQCRLDAVSHRRRLGCIDSGHES